MTIPASWDTIEDHMPRHVAVRKMIVPAAGLGTRLLPATKALPKELLPLVDRPIIQYGVEEAVRSGIRHVVLVTSPGDTMTAAHFAPHPALEALLAERGKSDLLATVRALATMVNVTTVHQEQPLGLGHAILCAKETVGEDSFAVLLPDDVIDADPPALKQMIDLFTELDGPVLLVERVAREAVSRYGIVDAEPVRDGVFKIRDLVEKPEPERTSSNLAIVGRYVLTPDVFAALEQIEQDTGREIQLTDGLRRLIHERPIYACVLTGTRHDAGTKLGLLQASIHFALKRPDLAPQLRAYLEAQNLKPQA